MRSLASAIGCPVLAGPVDQVRRWCLGHALPPYIAVVGQRDVGEDAIGLYRRHCIRIGLCVGTRSDTEEARFGVNRFEPAVRRYLDPGNVIANSRHLPAFLLESFRRNEHGKVGLAAGAWEGSGDVGPLTSRILDAQNKHVLCQPALVTCKHRGDAEREALLAEQSIATIT